MKCPLSCIPLCRAACRRGLFRLGSEATKVVKLLGGQRVASPAHAMARGPQ